MKGRVILGNLMPRICKLIVVCLCFCNIRIFLTSLRSCVPLVLDQYMTLTSLNIMKKLLIFWVTQKAQSFHYVEGQASLNMAALVHGHLFRLCPLFLAKGFSHQIVLSKKYNCKALVKKDLLSFFLQTPMNIVRESMKFLLKNSLGAIILWHQMRFHG